MWHNHAETFGERSYEQQGLKVEKWNAFGVGEATAMHAIRGQTDAARTAPTPSTHNTFQRKGGGRGRRHERHNAGRRRTQSLQEQRDASEERESHRCQRCSAGGDQGVAQLFSCVCAMVSSGCYASRRSNRSNANAVSTRPLPPSPDVPADAAATFSASANRSNAGGHPTVRLRGRWGLGGEAS